jgi:murein DD-endopeptidase MepM/ murein hydrolase activator NlpD
MIRVPRSRKRYAAGADDGPTQRDRGGRRSARLRPPASGTISNREGRRNHRRFIACTRCGRRCAGTVFSVGWNEVGGWRLWLRDRQGNQFYYAHLAGYTALAPDGAHVKGGDVLAVVGNTGDAFATPPHLHFEVHSVSLLGLGYDGIARRSRCSGSLAPLLASVLAGMLGVLALALRVPRSRNVVTARIPRRPVEAGAHEASPEEQA